MNEIDRLVGVLHEAHKAKQGADQAYLEALKDVLREGSDCDVMRATGMTKDAVRMRRKRLMQSA